MRYLLFFFIFVVQSNFAFSSQSSPIPLCESVNKFNNLFRHKIPSTSETCLANPATKSFFVVVNDNDGGNIVAAECRGSCACPEGSTWHQAFNIQSQRQESGCVPDLPDGNDPDCEFGSVYDPTTGEASCNDGSGNESSAATSAAASSSRCVIIGDYDGDCVPDGDSSTPSASTPNTSSPSSTGGGGDDSGNSPGGGGGDNGGGNNNGGGGGNSSVATSSPNSGVNNSWNPYSGYGNWIPVAENSNCQNKFKDISGQWWCAGANAAQASSSGSAMAFVGTCDPTSTTYFTCITSGAGANTSSPSSGSGSNSSWTPISGYGNWIPVGEDSNCPNKFKDASGSWWCSGGNGSGTGNGSGSNGSASGGAGGSGAAASAAGQCDPTASNYLSCIQQQTVSSAAASAGSASSSGSASSRSGSSSGTFSSLGEKGEFDGETSEKRMEELEEELNEKIDDIKEDILAQVGGTITGTGDLQDFCKSNIHRTEVCFGLEKWKPYLNPIAAAIFLVACVISFSIILRG